MSFKANQTFAFPVDDTPTPIEVITVNGSKFGNYTSSWSVSCRGMECKNSANYLSEQIQGMLAKAAQEFDEPEEIKEKFCEALEKEVPEYCGKYSFLGNRGSFFSLNPSTWNKFPAATNGCGSGAIENFFIGHAMGALDGFTSNMNEPIAGYSFLGACNNHDMCYNQQSGKGGCDDDFYTDMVAVCDSNDDCKDAAHAYRAAVGHEGKSDYDKAGEVKSCKDYKADFDQNCKDKS